MQHTPSVDPHPVQADAVQPPAPETRPDYDTVPVEQVLSPEEQPDTPPDYYRSQAEVDRAIGRRLAAARAKWEREAAGAAAASVSSPVSAVAPTAGTAPAQPTPSAGVMPAAGAGVEPAAGADEFTRQVLRGVAAIQVAYDPGFTLEGGFEASPDFKRLCLAGWDPVQAYELTLGREQDGREAIDRTRQRRSARPNPAPAGGGGVRLDFRNMTEANFKRIDARLKRGEHVRI